jgi:hypothetical protein
MENRVPATTLTDAEIIARSQSGELIDDIGRLDADDVDPASLLNRCIYLHNDGQIDLLSLVKTVRFNSLTTQAFFVRQRFFYKAIPKLETPTLPLMEAVQILVAKGGNDLASHHPNEAFRNWCAANPAKAQAIVAAAQVGDQTAIAFVTFALTALLAVDPNRVPPPSTTRTAAILDRRVSFQ